MKTLRDPSYQGSTFREVRDQVFSDPYETLPELPLSKVSLFRMFGKGGNLLYRAAKRTIKHEADILPYFDKLIHSNGVGFSGTWNITEDNPYTGLFREGTKCLMVARASVILTEIQKGAHRGFGFAGKIFPTMDPDERVKTGNFLLLNSFVGTTDRFYSDIKISNNPIIGTGWNLVKYFGVLATTLSSFPWADNHLTYRSMVQVARIGLEEGEEVNPPKYLAVQARNNRIQDLPDFRHELDVSNREGGKLILDVFTSEVDDKEARDWQRIGFVELTESIASESTDHRLHFHHLKLRGSGIKKVAGGL